MEGAADGRGKTLLTRPAGRGQIYTSRQRARIVRTEPLQPLGLPIEPQDGSSLSSDQVPADVNVLTADTGSRVTSREFSSTVPGRVLSALGRSRSVVHGLRESAMPVGLPVQTEHDRATLPNASEPETCNIDPTRAAALQRRLAEFRERHSEASASTSSSESGKSDDSVIHVSDSLRHLSLALENNGVESVEQSAGTIDNEAAILNTETVLETKTPNLVDSGVESGEDLSIITSKRRGIGRGRGRSVCVVLPTLGLNRYAFKISYLNAPPALETLDKTETFLVTSALSFNTFHIVPKSSRLLNMLKVSDTIAMAQEQLPFLQTKPLTGDIVLVESPGMSLYVRAEVTGVTMIGPNADQITVKEVDTGRIVQVRWDKLKSVNDLIMALPIIGYDVKLRELSDTEPKIYEVDFEAFVRKLRKARAEYKLIKCAEHEGTYSLIGTESRKSLGMEILRLGKWQWEKIRSARELRTDRAIEEAGSWEGYPSSFQSTPAVLPWNDYFLATVGKAYNLDKALATNVYSIWIKPQTPRWFKMAKTLEAQMEAYMKKVKPSPFYPASNEPALVRTPEDLKWHRMIRYDTMTDAFYDVDKNEFVRIAKAESNHEFRMMPRDFFRIPMLTIEAAIVGLDISVPGNREALEEIVKGGATLHFQLIKSDQHLLRDSGINVVRCLEVDERFGLDRHS